MTSTFFHGVGGVLSADIAVPDHERELEFYSKVLTTGDAALWRDDLLNNHGTPVIGLGAVTPEYSFLPLQWMPHFQVADVASSVVNAIDMGGTKLMHSETDNGVSDWAVLTDTMGAAFGVIPVVPEEANATTSNRPLGCISWLSLTASDALLSRNFYQRVIGWNCKQGDSEKSGERRGSFLMQASNGTVAAEICQGSHMNDSIPPVWLIHLPVGELDESLRRVNDRGGLVIHRNLEARYAVVSDPVGVCFALSQPAEAKSGGDIHF